MKLFIFIILAFLFSCSIHTNKPELYLSYNNYLSYTDKENIKNVHSKYFSNELIGSESFDDPDVIDQLLFKNYMEKQYNNFETIKSNIGCLTVNGFDKSNEPIAFNLEYVLLNKRWLINSIHILFLENKTKFSTTAKCPIDYKQ